ncbi:MAG: cold shock domain-containing protein [Microvirga sp.]
MRALLRRPAGLNGALPIVPLRNGLVQDRPRNVLVRSNGSVEKGLGFIAQDRGGKDVFVHATTLERSGLSELAEGWRARMQISQRSRLGRSSSWTERT